MAQFPALPLWTDAYLADTRHLTPAEHGAYLLLLIEAWRRPACNLPDDDGLLCRLTGMSADAWTAAKPIIMAFWKRDGRSKTWTQKRLKKERDRVARFSKSQTTKAAKRWKDTEKPDAPAIPRQCPADASISIYPLPKGKGADAPPADPIKALFDAGVALLAQSGMADRSARSLIGKWRKENGDRWTREAIASAAGKSDPAAWITGLKRSANSDQDEARAASAATAERYRRMAIAGPPSDAMSPPKRERI